MRVCIFCPNELTESTKPEHILLSALGGRKTTNRTVCSDCNQTFGGTMDAAVAKQVAILRNQLQLESGTGKSPPSLKRVQAGNEQININSDGTPELVSRPFTVTELGDGKFNLQIAVRSPEELVSLMPHIAAQMRTTEDIVREQLRAANATVIYRRPGTVHFSTPFGGDLECRSFLKSCLVLWATRVGNAELKSDPYRIAREHVANVVSAGAARSATEPAAVFLDTRPMPHLDVLTARYGDLFNLIYVRSDAAGRVIGRFTLYNIISWQFVLAEFGGTPDLKIGLISNPLKPADWSDTIADEVDIDMEWLSSPHFDPLRTRDRLSAVMARVQQSGLERELGRIVGVASQRHGLAPNDPITDPIVLEQMIGEISIRAVHHATNIPYEEVISGEALLGPLTDITSSEM